MQKTCLLKVMEWFDWKKIFVDFAEEEAFDTGGAGVVALRGVGEPGVFRGVRKVSRCCVAGCAKSVRGVSEREKVYSIDIEQLPHLPGGKEWLPVRNGESGDRVYRRSDGAAYAKLATAGRNRSLLEEYRRTEWLAAAGIACPQVLDWSISEQSACLVTSALPGVPASELSASELIRAWPSIALHLKSLHGLPVAACPFERELAGMFACAEEVVARAAVNPDFLAPSDRDIPPSVLLHRLREEMPHRLAQEPTDLVVCHGDACLPNFLIDSHTLTCTGMIDLGRLGKADRYVDFSLLLSNASEIWRSQAEAQTAAERLFASHSIKEPDMARLLFYLQLDPLTWDNSL